MSAVRSKGTRALWLAAALLSSGGCRGCQRAPSLRLTYDVDVAHAYDGPGDTAKLMETTRGAVARRLDELAIRASVSARGEQLVVDLAALEPDELSTVKSVIARSGRLALKVVDDAGSAAFFAGLGESVYPAGEDIAPSEESAPDGLGETGRAKEVRASYARMTCRPATHDRESTGDCLTRLRTWAAALPVPKDHELGFESVEQPVPGTEPPRFEQVGWRTLYLLARTEVSGASVADARAGREPGAGGYYVSVTFNPAGAARFEEISSANVNRRLAILVDDVITSAPVIRTKIAGGKATITMGAGDPEKQLRDARELELELRSGALPAPLRLLSEEALAKGR